MALRIGWVYVVLVGLLSGFGGYCDCGVLGGCLSILWITLAVWLVCFTVGSMGSACGVGSGCCEVWVFGVVN